MQDIFLSSAPIDVEKEFSEILSPSAVQFVVELHRQFQPDVKKLHSERRQRSANQSKRPSQIIQSNSSEDWVVDDVPLVLKDRRLDLGDVSPANVDHFKSAMNADVQGIQVDFDDGHCPNWRNNILGLHNVTLAVHNRLRKVPDIQNSPLLMFRPRAWNITEHNMLVDGRAVPGPLFDFGFHMYHNGKRLQELNRGPFFYLSKLESAREAALWNRIFIWSQQQLQIPFGTIKATVLIEDILAAFEMEDILYSLRHHSAGLNCGIWDYCASIVARFGEDPAFLLPDRNKYVNMDKKFLMKYMELAVKTCRRRNTFATGGMAALLADSQEAIEKVLVAKKKEIQAGVAGFMVYDVRLVPHIKELWAKTSPIISTNQEEITSDSLLLVPSGGVTEEGLTHNIQVALLFIRHWQIGLGHFVLNSAVEDSATAEISRWQVYQWLLNKTEIEGSNKTVTYTMIQNLVQQVREEKKLPPAVGAIFLRLLALEQPPQFITTFLSDHHLLNSDQNKVMPNL